MSFTDMMLPHSFYKEKAELCHAVYSYSDKKKKRLVAETGCVIISFSQRKTWQAEQNTKNAAKAFPWYKEKNLICQTWWMQRYGTFIDAPETGSLMDIDNRTADMSRRVDFEERRGCRCSSHSAKCCNADGTEIQHTHAAAAVTQGSLMDTSSVWYT